MAEAMRSRGSANPARRCTIVCVEMMRRMHIRMTIHLPILLHMTLSILARDRQARMHPA